MKKPRIMTRCVANTYTTRAERIAEFGTDHGGGLISIRDMGDYARVEVYRCDEGVRVIAPALAGHDPDALLAALRVARDLIAEAMEVHIYGDDETPEPECNYTAGLAQIDAALAGHAGGEG